MVRTLSGLLLAVVLWSMPSGARPSGRPYLPATPAAPSILEQPADADLLVVAHADIVLPPGAVTPLPALPEPAVFIMMLLGVGVLGYRSRRHASETFR